MQIFRIRLFFVLTALLLISFILLLRLGYLFTVQKKFLEKQGDARSLRTVLIPAYRGMILDRYGQPMAVSTPVATVWVNPSIINGDDNLKNYNYNNLDKLLDLPKNTVQHKALENTSKEFVYIKRQIAPDLAQLVDELKLPGVFTKKEFKRYYPNGEVTAHVTGFTSIDEIGQEGMEKAYEKVLAGIPGKTEVLKDRLGRTIKTIRQKAVAKPGENISLTIDLRLQYLTYLSLKQAIQKHAASAGVAIILDIKTGEILALANQPSFNPNYRFNFDHNEIRNRAITDLFEPGSLLKPISMVAALNTGKFNNNTLVDTTPGYMAVGNKKVRDIHNYGVLTLNDILKKSSNVGITKLTLGTEPNNLINLLYNMGFAAPTSLNLQGEATGWINQIKSNEDFKLATLAFGYGISATPVQILQAYSIIANHGELIPVTLIKENLRIKKDVKKSARNPVIPAKIADEVLTMLNSVMQDDGTGRLARIPNYNIAGKTGTSRRLTKNGYDENSHNSMFIGLAPYPDPKLAMLVFIIDPKQNGYYGGMVAGPVFREVMTRAMQLYGIPPNLA